MAAREISIKKWGLRTLQEFGVATQNFPHYTNDRLDIHRLDVVLLSFIMRGTCAHLIDDRRYTVRGPSIGITYLNQTHCIFTEDGGIDVMNNYLNPDRLPLPELPSPLQEMLPRLLPLNSMFANRLNRVQQIDLPDDSPLPAIAQLLDRDLVCVDLETTGGNTGWHRIMEIGLVTVLG